MNLSGNTILITGGGSGIGRGLAEALHARGNQVIISGRRKAALEETTAANRGMVAVELDVQSPESIQAVARDLIARFPKLNVVINNAGIMKIDDVHNAADEATISSIVNTNLLGPIRLTSAFLEHLKLQPEAAVVYVTSGLAFTPLAQTATYSATKAAIHSFAMSQRFLLQGTSIRVLEIAPPYVQTELMGEAQKNDPRAMPLDEFIAETLTLLGTDADEILVERVKPLRNNAGPNEHAFVKQFNEMMRTHHR